MKQTDNQLFFFAQAYGQGAYGAGTYSGCTVNTQTGVCVPNKPADNTLSATLVNTGLGIAVITGLAVIIIISALAVKFSRKPKNEKGSGVDSNDDPNNSQGPTL